MPANQYAAWAERWARGMQASEHFTRQRREAQRAVAVANRKRGAEHPCGIKGCTRHSYKGRLCRKHWSMVPQSDKITMMVAAMDAQMRAAQRHYPRFLRELQARLDAAMVDAA